jgi:hypothetical protein
MNDESVAIHVEEPRFHRSSFIVHHSSFIVHLSSRIIHHSGFFIL